MGLPDFKSGVPSEKGGRWVRFPCTSAIIFYNIKYLSSVSLHNIRHQTVTQPLKLPLFHLPKISNNSLKSSPIFIEYTFWITPLTTQEGGTFGMILTHLKGAFTMILDKINNFDNLIYLFYKNINVFIITFRQEE